MKILFVAIPGSIHTARWINQISNKHETYIFSSVDDQVGHSSLKNTKLVSGKNLSQFNLPRFRNFDTTIKDNYVIHKLKSAFNLLNLAWYKFLNIIDNSYKLKMLCSVITEIKPDLIHCLEMQSAGYLVYNAKRIFSGNFPYWILSIWGSDIYFFGQKNEHRKKIKNVIQNVDFILCESTRDINLAIQFGAKKKNTGLLPSTGGFDTRKLRKYSMSKPSQRKDIVIKGYQGWSGRALVALQALEKCSSLITKYKYRLVLHSADHNGVVETTLTKMCVKHQIPYKIIPQGEKHTSILKIYGRARCSISISITDGVPNSLTESMVMGTFPIQTVTSAANEWIEDRKTGFLVSANSIDEISASIATALTDDKLVDMAALTNRLIISRRLDSKKIQMKTLEFYQKINSKNNSLNSITNTTRE